VAIGRTASVLVLSPIILRERRTAESLRNSSVIWAAAVGILDVAAIAAYAKAAAAGPVSLAAASATYPIVPIIGAVLLLRERLRRRQWDRGCLRRRGISHAGSSLTRLRTVSAAHKWGSRRTPKASS
jgi:uncharacterized membrane protein